MTLKSIGEFGFIEAIRPGCLIRPDNVLKGIGDDAAVFTGNSNETMLLTTDLLVERIHFLRKTTSAFNLGRKALAVNLSDIAAMGGTPLDAFVGIAIPDDCSLDMLKELYDGMKSIAAEFDVNILGGDTTGSKIDLVISICLTGCVPNKHVLYRHAARPGDRIYTTGRLGDSRAGLMILQNSGESEKKTFDMLVSAHLLPRPHVREGRFLAMEAEVHAAIDVSDGLSADIAHIALQSGVGVRLYREKIPLSEPLKDFCDRLGLDPVDVALTGGEDYVLLVTVSPKAAQDIETRYRKVFAMPLFQIGEIVEAGRMEILGPDARIETLRPSGWDHFKSR
jgi:thiamine-monophosphate kinase